MKTFLTKNLVAVVIGAALVLSIGFGLWYTLSSNPPTFTATAAAQGNVVASLSESATVLAENNSNLSFQEGGQIAHVYVTEGQTVSAGTILADLSSASLQASAQQASAALAAAQANLAQAASGTRPEQLTIDETAVTNAQTAIGADIGNAYTAADDAVHNQTDNLFSNPSTNNPTFLIPTTDSQVINNIETGRISMQAVLGNWYTALNSSTTNLSSLTNIANSALANVQAYLDSLALAVNDATPQSNLSVTALNGYKANVAAGRAEVAVTISTLTAAESALQTAQNTLSLAQAGSTPQAIQAQEAVVAQAQAGATAAQVALNNASLVALFPGTVQNLTAQIGQVVSPGAPVLTLVNNSGLKIQAYVSETDVAKVKVGDLANVALDAFNASTTFGATVTAIDDSETQVNGTPAYLVTLHFTNAQPLVKDGMTGNVDIVLAEDDNVVEVPSRLVINNGNSYFVTIQTATGTAEVPVSIGLVGDNGMTEIKSGINAGQQLANF